jgi:hypothetical protein
MPNAARDAAAILEDLQALDRENDRIEFCVALATQSLKAAEAHREPHTVLAYLDRAESQLRQAG